MPIALTAVKKGNNRKALDSIDPDVIEAVEEAYKHCLEVDDERIRASFGTQEEADDFLSEARSYAFQRPGGRVVVTGNSTKKGFANFRVETYVAPVDEPEGE